MSATVWAYPRDLLDEGVARAADCVAGLGLDGIRMAMAYHSGKFVSPRGAHRRVVFPEGGVTYFRPRASGFHALAIQPVLIDLLEGAGIEHIAFYNYGVLPHARLGWFSEAAQAFRS